LPGTTPPGAAGQVAAGTPNPAYLDPDTGEDLTNDWIYTIELAVAADPPPASGTP
jgi:hypothetical protein